MKKVAVIAALERELSSLVRGWETVTLERPGHRLRVFERENAVALAGGIGSHAAGIAAQMVVEQYQPEMLISAGLAGALISSLKAGSVLTPNVIIDAVTGAEYRSSVGGGILLTAGEIANHVAKPQLVEKFHALAVDMEAAAVAEVARQRNISFRCVKAISDEAGFVLPPLNRFVDPEGKFQAGRFAVWLAVHPHYWSATMALARNSQKASKNLCDWLERHLA
jgi:adenosylhomocysteine nucleosidase